jgi:hypothetical protein
MLIKLSKKDMHTCTVLGNDTVKICEMQGFPPRLENKNQTREEANIEGYKGEFAVARLFDLEEPTFNITSDFGADLWWNDSSIDVKTTKTKDLIFDSMEKFKSDIAVLARPTDQPDVIEVGKWISRIEFEHKHHLHDYGYGERLVMKYNELRDIESLWKQMKIKTLSPRN